MLFKPTTLPEDLTASVESNHIMGELKFIRSDADTVFCLSKGPYFTDGIRVVDDVTGVPLVIHQDYDPIQLYMRASTASGRAVWAALKIKKKSVQAVRIDYRAIGGRFQNFLGVILEMKDQFDPDYIAKIPWPSLTDKPAEYWPAPHAHSFWDIYNLKATLDGLYQVVVAIHIKQRDRYHDLFADIAAQFTTRLMDVNDKFNQLVDRVEWYRNAVQYDELDILVTKNPNNPANYLHYGTWALLPDVLLIGASEEEELGELVGLAGAFPGDWQAIRVFFWQRQDDKLTFRVTVTANKTQMNEGDSVTFTISSPGRVAGTAMDWVLTGVQEQDIAGGAMTGTVFLNESGSASVTIQTTADQITEGIEYLRLYVVGYPNRFAQVTLNDTSTNPVFECYFSENNTGTAIVTDASEGDLVYLIVKATYVSPISTYHLVYTGSTISAADFTATMPTTVEVIDGFAAVPYQIRKDQITEGYEHLVVSISTSTDISQALVSNRLRIRDTSKTPTYLVRITSDMDGNNQITNVNEGQSFYLHIITTDMETGTEISLGYNGTYDPTDFTSTLPNKVILTNNYARIKYDVRADGLSESNEFIEIFVLLGGTRIAAASVTLNDTSVDANYRMYFSSNRFGTNELSWANEGSEIYLIVQAGGVSDGTALPLRYRGQAIAADFSNNLPTNVIIEHEVGFVQYQITEDYKTEGNETLVVSLMNPSGDTELASANINIIDTSQEPVYDLKFTSDQFGSNTITEVDEGGRVYVHVSATGVASITTLGVDVFIGGLRATIANGDVSELPPASVTLINGKGTFYIQTRADSVTEGDELLNVRIRATQATSSPVVKQADIVVRDTSQDPTWSIKLTYDEEGEDEVLGDLLEGDVVYLQWHSENVADHTVFWIGYGNGQSDNATEEDFLDPLPGALTVIDNRATIRYRVRQDYLMDRLDGLPEKFIINIYSNVSMTNRILLKEINILDPSFQMKFSGNPVGTGNITQANEGDIVYLVVDSVNVPDGTVFNLEYYVDGILTTAAGIDFVDDPHQQITINNNRGILSIAIKADGIPDGQKLLQIQLHGLTTVIGQVPLAVANLSMIDTSNGGVTEAGVYRPNEIGTLSIPAHGVRHITLVGGGGNGYSGTDTDPDTPPFLGTGGQATSFRFGASTLFIAAGGEGGARLRGEATPGGEPYVNYSYLDVVSQFTVTDLVVTPGHDAFMDSNAGAPSSAPNNTGAGANGSLTATGGGGGACIAFTITNNTNALMSFGVTIGRGGISLSGGTATDWNNGSIILNDE